MREVVMLMEYESLHDGEAEAEQFVETFDFERFSNVGANCSCGSEGFQNVAWKVGCFLHAFYLSGRHAACSCDALRATRPQTF